MNVHRLILFWTLTAASQYPCVAESLSQAVNTQVDSNQAALTAQRDIDKLGEQTRRALDEYRDTLRQTEALEAYNAHLRQLVSSQESTRQSLEKQIRDIELTRRDLVPLMLSMVDALDRFVQLDRPFLKDERTRRINDLKELMTRADIGDTEKFRRILESYQSESDFGKSIETYRADLVQSGTTRTVDFLRFGRAALLYRTLDGKESGAWSTRTQTWKPLPARYGIWFDKGLAVARREKPPELLPIPVEIAEAAQ